MSHLFDFIDYQLSKKRLNIFKTIYFNFSVFPFSIAIKLPVLLYGHIRNLSLRGQCILNGSVKYGMVRIGIDFTAYRTKNITTITIHRSGLLILEENVKIYQGATLFVAKDAVLSIGKESTIGDGTEIICFKKIKIGKNVDLTWDCQVTDYKSHFILDIEHSSLQNIFSPVVIGDYCWICNRTSIQPGTVLPNYTIVASNSLLNKDYISLGIDSKSLIGGIPAVLIKKNVARVYNTEQEILYMNYFRESNDKLLIIDYNE